MSVLSMASSRSSETETELEHKLALSLSGQLARIPSGELGEGIAAALHEVAVVTGLESCQLLEFGENGTVVATHAPTRAATTLEPERQPPMLDQWLIARLARGEVVAVSRPEDLPREAVIL